MFQEFSHFAQFSTNCRKLTVIIETVQNHNAYCEQATHSKKVVSKFSHPDCFLMIYISKLQVGTLLIAVHQCIQYTEQMKTATNLNKICTFEAIHSQNRIHRVIHKTFHCNLNAHILSNRLHLCNWSGGCNGNILNVPQVVTKITCKQEALLLQRNRAMRYVSRNIIAVF